jgi:hypothetical protein
MSTTVKGISELWSLLSTASPTMVADYGHRCQRHCQQLVTIVIDTACMVTAHNESNRQILAGGQNSSCTKIAFL